MNDDSDVVLPHREFGCSVLRIMAQLMRAARRRRGLSRQRLADELGVRPSLFDTMEDATAPAQQLVELIRYCTRVDIDPSALIEDACHQWREYDSRNQAFTVAPTVLPAPPPLYRLDALRADVVADQTRRLMIEARTKAHMSDDTMGLHLGCSGSVILKMEYRGPYTPDPLRVRPFLSYCDALGHSPATLLRTAITAARDITA